LASFDRAAAILFALSEKTEIIVGDRPCRTSVLDGRGAVLHSGFAWFRQVRS
jgi:hypothetical protein